MMPYPTGRSTWVLALLLPLIIVGCRRREPWGNCPYEDLEVSRDFTTPWGTTFEDDLVQLEGSYPGTFAWRDGENVVTVPKAGQEFEAEAIVEIDPTTARMREYQSTEDTPVCDTDYLFMEARITFVRLDDGEVERTTSITVDRDDEWSRYRGKAKDTPVAELFPDLVPHMDFQTEEIWTSVEWGEDGSFCAAYDYYGSSRDPSSSGSSSGHGVSKLVAEFTMPSARATCP